MLQASNEKILGGLGSIFIILSFIPWIGWLLGIVGIVLLFIAIHKLSQVFANKNIFSKFLTGFLIGIVGAILAFILGFIIGIATLGLGLVLVFVILYPLSIVVTYFYRQCFNLIYQYTEIKLFKLAGDFMFWGAVGLIAFGLGSIAIIVGWILLAIAFFNLPDHYGKKTG